MSTSTSKRPRRHNPDPAPPHDPFEDEPTVPRTWWQRHAITVMATFSLVMLVFVIAFQTAC
jgi:hypothetical protein